MNKWAGRQNGGNQCHGTEYRKKNEKKWDQSKTSGTTLNMLTYAL